MIVRRPECEHPEPVYRKEGDEDFIQIICDGCNQLYFTSLIRCEAREQVYVNDENC